eukprot:4780530-Lingulodinium_polyedra.AAC.1
MALKAPWCSRVVATDASPGGHGMAYARVPDELPPHWGRLAAHRGDYTALLAGGEFEAREGRH